MSKQTKIQARNGANASAASASQAEYSPPQASGTPPDMDTTALIHKRLFVVPSSSKQKEIPFARVNHNKYMVTDKIAYIGTSNWSGDYFVSTAGSALVVNQTASQSVEPTVQSQLQAVFERDWNSDYSTPLTQHSNLKNLC
ncbi:5'-3' exonuclease PLD3-like [Acanthopagrus latus]|uniref:5'-3' exonuclease PLD3-like n=1 Tax=Acanthopagrus latus TaxID=8177 RepID=UPI00187C40F0|nr:5'-3' exonuclease PLD3-like [Acanthopagrus latus]